MAGAPKTILVARAEPALVADVERAIRAAGALPLAKLTRVKLTAEARIELERLLVERGLERGPKAMRVPVDAQLAELVQGGRRVPLKDVPKRVKGAAKAELDPALTRLVRAGSARVVVRTAALVLVGGAEPTLDPAEIAQIAKIAAQLGKTLKKVTGRGGPRSLLREDLAALLAPVERAARPARPTATATAATDAPRALLLEAIRRLENPTLRLVRVPDLVRALAGQLGVDEVHRALFEEVDGGAIELRPDAGGEFLTDDDARLCPPGPRGTVFSYARRRSP